MTPEQNLYNVARKDLGLSLYDKLNPNIPEEEGCAETVSFILKQAGYVVPLDGIPTVNGLIGWMLANGFIEQSQNAAGYIIAAHNANHSITTFAHIGICLKYGIGSNNSNTGIFDEHYTYNSWYLYFGGKGGSLTRYFSPPAVLTNETPQASVLG